jgi:hypothetical protein
MRLGLGLGLSSGAGGSGILSMPLGVNLAGVNSYSGIYPFANIMYNGGVWARRVGSGSFTQNQGELTATVGTDEFRMYLSDTGLGLPAGTYTVYNPAGAEIGLGAFSNQSVQAYTTATTFTFSYTPSANGLYLHCKGSLSKASGNLAIILPGHSTSWLAGDHFNSAFISFHQGLGAQVLRFMDWGIASVSIETDWADRTQPDGITFYNPMALGSVVPYELMIELCNRLGVDPWICVPARATSDYVTQLATLLDTDLDVTRKLYPEEANEVWNTADPWGDGAGWIQYLDHTRRTATANFGADTYTLTAHGITHGATIASFATKENRIALASDTAVDYRTRLGTTSYVEVIDANTFKLHETSVAGPVVPVSSGQVNLLFVVIAEPGKTPNIRQHYGELCLRNWDAFDAALGVGRVEHLIAGQAVNTTVASDILATTGVSARTDSVSPAPYFTGAVFGGAVDISTGQLLPKFWCSKSSTAHVGIYAAGATPTIDEVIAGTGAINKQTIARSGASPSTFTSGVAVTGLSNGTTYSVHYVVVDNESYEWKMTANATVSATTSTVDLLDTYTNMAARDRSRTTTSVGYVTAHQALKPRVICYEGGNHSSDACPASIQTWREGYMESQEFADAMEEHLYRMATVGTKLYCYFSDACPSNSVFGMATNYDDTADKRYIAFSAFGGTARAAALTVAAVVATDVLTDPGSFPYVVHTFANAALTYTLVNGNNDGNFAIVGNELRMIGDYSINWGLSNSENLTVEANDGKVSSFFNVTFSVGTLAAGGVAAPTLTGTPTLLASWDFANDSTITNVSGAVSAISGADGTSFTLNGPGGSANPPLSSVSGKQAAGFASASSQKLTGAHISGVTGACSFVAIVKMDSVAASGNLFEVAQASAGSNTNRLQLLVSSSTGFQSRQHDNASTQSVASVGSAPNTVDTHLVIGTFPNASTTVPTLNVNGQGTAINGTPSANAAASMSQTSMGCRTVGGTAELFANAKVFRVLVYNGALTTTQREEIAVWANTNYGTANT